MGKRHIMATAQKDTINRESGFALVSGMLILALMTIIGIAATTTSTIEMKIAGNENQYMGTFYNTEGVLINMLEAPSVWLTPGFLTIGEIFALYSGTSGDTAVEIRCVEATGTDIDGLSDEANDLPVTLHRDAPPVGSGYSMNDFEAHRYGITTTSPGGNTRIQAGVWKAFNKF